MKLKNKILPTHINLYSKTVHNKHIFNFEKNHLIRYLYLILSIFSIFLFLSIIYDISQIHIYRHDSLYYMPNANTYYHMKVATEGRWINYLLFDISDQISGRLLSVFILFSFAYFIFTAVYQWSKNYYYSFMLSLFFIQIPSLYDSIMWPATSAPAIVVLLLAIFLQRKLNIFLYFILFGILFFGTISTYYYLLPLLFLIHFSNPNKKQNIAFFLHKLLPAWASGFIIGYIATQVIVYMNFGHFIIIANWRSPHYVHSLNDLVENIMRSLTFFKEHLNLLFSHNWHMALSLFALILSNINRRKDIFFLSFILFFLITIVHYIITIPIGIFIAPRTIISVWVGIFSAIFFVPSIKKWQIYFLVPIIVFFTFTLYLNNHYNLKWYRHITNTYYDSLISESPKPPSYYKGIILYASDRDIQKQNKLISRINNITSKVNIENLDAFGRWVPIAKEAGFRSVINCNKIRNRSAIWNDRKDIDPICTKVSKIVFSRKNITKNNYAFYHIIGELDGNLIISLNKNWYRP